MLRPTWEDGVKSKTIYLANFDWSKAFWNPLNGSESMDILAMRRSGGIKDVAQLWVIGKIEHTTLVVKQYPCFTVELCSTGDDRDNLRLMLKKWGNLGQDLDPSNVESVVNFSTRLEKVEELIQLITGNEKVRDIVRAIHFQDTFPINYDVRRSANVDDDYPDPGYDVDDLKTGATVAVEFQIHSRNFKASKKIDGVKTYSFRLLGVYPTTWPINCINARQASTRKRRIDGHTSAYKNHITSMNPPEF